MMNMTATEVSLLLQQWHLEFTGKYDPAIQSWLDQCYDKIICHIVSDMRQNELALQRITDDGCPLFAESA